MNEGDILLKKGILPAVLDERIRTALACGALQPIQTVEELVEDGGVRFLVRMVSSLRRKEEDKNRRAAAVQRREKPANPFLPPEPELTVAEISRTHIAVLNKFNVLNRHLLVVTRRFEHQETLLTPADFQTLLLCMSEYRSLGFYNGGAVAGASQPHKHLQLVPLPLASGGTSFPMQPLLARAGRPRCLDLSFPHAFATLTPSIGNKPPAAAEAHALYLDLLADVGIRSVSKDAKQYQSAPYNLLLAQDWMLAVPRRQELYRGISVNALGFAGSFFVKDREQLRILREDGPMRVLQAVA
ncbi:MAG: phosphorylase [Pseudomonadota bacterium]|nr:phosphorylase [Pseudomonadota bacterium]